METANIVSTEKNIVSLALADIQPSTYNPRKRFDEAALAELAANIRQQGVLQPIGVRPVADTGRFEIIFGERRYRASLMAEQAEIPAIVLDASDEGGPRNGRDGKPATRGRQPHGGGQRLPKAHRKRSPRRALAGRSVRQERELHPHAVEIPLPDTRNRGTFGSGRADGRRGRVQSAATEKTSSATCTTII